jgi:hypothetical protein
MGPVGAKSALMQTEDGLRAAGAPPLHPSREVGRLYGRWSAALPGRQRASVAKSPALRAMRGAQGGWWFELLGR